MKYNINTDNLKSFGADEYVTDSEEVMLDNQNNKTLKAAQKVVELI